MPVSASVSRRQTVSTAVGRPVIIGDGLHRSRAAASAAIIAGDLDYVQTAGYSEAGDGGGALYKKGDADTPGGFTSANGRELELVPGVGGIVCTNWFPGAIHEQIASAVEYVLDKRSANPSLTWLPDAYRIIVQPGAYDLEDTVLVASARNITLDASGVLFRMLDGQDFTAFKAVASPRLRVRGLGIDCRNNNNVPEAFLLAGQCSWAILSDCAVQGNSSDTDFAALRLKQGDADGFDDDSRDKGNFWVTVERFWTRKLTGGDANDIGIGIDLQGCQNAVRIRDCSFSNVGVGVLVRNQNGSASSSFSNDVQIHQTAFESFVTGIEWRAENSANIAMAGGSVTGCRFETGATAFKTANLLAIPAQPVAIHGSTVISSVSEWISGPLRNFANWDNPWTPGISSPFVMGAKPFTFGSISGGGASMRAIARAQSQGGSLQLVREDLTTVDGILAQRPGGGMDVFMGNGGRIGPVRGLSGTGTLPNNFRGFVANPASGTTIDVTFSTAEPDTSYRVMCFGDENRTYWVTNKTTAGFKINTNTDFTGTGETGWLLVR